MTEKQLIEWAEYFYYDETSPTCLRWKSPILGGATGKTVLVEKDAVAGYFAKRKNGQPMCVRVKVNYKLYRVHRIIYELLVDKISGKLVIDHLNQNPWDNRICNLALKLPCENHRNKKQYINNSSGVTGVQWITKGLITYAEGHLVFNGKKFSKRFSVKRLGLLPAFKMAYAWREGKMKDINEVFSAGFTAIHGK